MKKSKTIERRENMFKRAKDVFKKRGWGLTSKEYINNHTKLDYVCDRGHSGSIRLMDFKQKSNCPVCIEEDRMNRIRNKIEEYENKGWTVGYKEYINKNTEIDYTCPKGHTGSRRWSSFVLDCDCIKCERDKCSENYRHGLNYVIEGYKQRGLTVVSKKYNNSETKLDYICEYGHSGSMSWNNFKQGQRCSTCVEIERRFDKYLEILFAFKKKGWNLKSKEYISSRTPLDFVCERGHEVKMTWLSFQQDHVCLECFYEDNVGEIHQSWKGGCTRKQYCSAWYDKEYKLDIKERDGYRCQNPYCKCNGGILVIHHIDYNPMNCYPSNLILICDSCHGMSNGNREWHIKWYQTLMAHKHGYVY